MSPHVSGMSRRSAVAALAAAAAGTACGIGRRSDASLDALAEHYVRAALALAQHQPTLVEAWHGPDAWRPGPREPVAQIRHRLDDAHRAANAVLASGTGDPRARYLHQQVGALVLACRRLAGEALTFDDEAALAFGAPVVGVLTALASEARQASWHEARLAVEWLLPGRSVLQERYAAFRARHVIPADRVAAAVEAASSACRRRLAAHLALPPGESVRTGTSATLGVEGQATYEGALRTSVFVEQASRLDLARLVWLVAHETYPGHHVQHVLADSELVQRLGWQERALHPSFGGHLLFAEGAAEAGAALLLAGDVFADVCREVAESAAIAAGHVAELVAVQRAVIELDLHVARVARAYLDGGLSRHAAAEQLTTSALILDAERLLLVIERQRTRVLVYPAGRRIVFDHLKSGNPWDRLKSVATLLVL